MYSKQAILTWILLALLSTKGQAVSIMDAISKHRTQFGLYQKKKKTDDKDDLNNAMDLTKESSRIRGFPGKLSIK